MRAPAQGNGKGRSLRGRTNGAALVALPPFLPPQEAWRALSQSLDWPAKPLSEALGISGGVQKRDPPPGSQWFRPCRPASGWLLFETREEHTSLGPVYPG